MPDLVEQMYCSQQIIIPPNLPSILKKFAKAAIRTQPSDLLLWSSAYFHALKEGITPPVKERFEYPPPISESGLSPGFLKVLINQLGKGDTVPRDTLETRWKGVCLNVEPLEELFKLGGFFDKIDWKKFIALAAGSIEPNLTRTMILFCELMTEEPEGGSASIPLDLFIDIYTYLAKLNSGPEDFRIREESEKGTLCPEITAEHQPVVCDCKIEGPQKVTWEEAIADLERIDSGFSVETVIVDAGNLFYTWPTIEDELEDMGNEEELSRYADSSYGLQVWDDAYGSSSYEMLYSGEEKRMTEEEHKMFLTTQDTIVLEPPEDNLNYEEFTDEEISEVEVRKKDAESEDLEDVFAPKIDSLREILDDEYVGEQEGEELEGVEQASSLETLDVNPEEEEEEKEFLQDQIEDNIITIIQPDTDIHHMPTPITSEVSLIIDEQPEPEAPVDVHDPSQQLAEKQSLIDVRVVVDEPLAPEAEKEEIQVRDPYWKHVSGIGPVVPDEIVEDVIKYLKEVASYQNQMVMPKNLRHFKCPPLEIIENQQPDENILV